MIISSKMIKVKFVGKRGGSNIFKMVVTAAWQSNQMRSIHTIQGVELEVESKIPRKHSGSNLSRDRQNIDKSKSGSSERLRREAWKGVHGRGKSSWWKTHGTREDREVKEAIAIKKEDRHFKQLQSGTRDLQVQEGKLDLPRCVYAKLFS